LRCWLGKTRTGASSERSWRTEAVRYVREFSLCLAWLTAYAWWVHLPVRSLLGALVAFAAAAWPASLRHGRLGIVGATALTLLLGPLMPVGLVASAGIAGLALYRGRRALALPEDPAGAFMSGACQFVLLWWMDPPAGTRSGLIAVTLAFLVAALMRMVQCASRDDDSSRPLPLSGAAVLPVLAPVAAALAATGLLRPGLLREIWDALASVLAGALTLLAYPFIRLMDVGIRSLKPRLAATPGWQLPAQSGLVPENGAPGAGARIVGAIILLVFGAPLALWLGGALFAWLRSALRDGASPDARTASVRIVRERLSGLGGADDKLVQQRKRPRYGRDRIGRIRRLYWLAARQARHVGCPVTAGTTPALLQEMLAKVYPDHRRTLEALISLYNQARYGKQCDPSIDVNQLEREWAALVRTHPLPGRPGAQT